MASPIDPWIASLVENCLTVRWKSSQVEDDGSNLRFYNASQQLALVNSWSEGYKAPTINVTDLHAQIDAVLAKESMETYRREYPNHPLTKDTTRGRYLQLLEFEVVFEYSLSEPKLHLYVTHFKIASDKGLYKGPPRGKGMKKHPTPYKLMWAVLAQVKSREKRHNSLTDVSCFNEPPQSQPRGSSHLHDTQDFLASQVQPTLHLPSRPSAGFATPEKGSTSSNKLLELLGPDSKTATHSLAASRAKVAPLNPAGRAQSIGAEKLGQAHSNGPQAVEAPQSNPDEVERSGAQPSKPDVNQGHLKPDGNVEGTTNSKVILVGSSGNKSPDKATSGAEGSFHAPESKNSDPWHGMTKIHKRDVTIPKNQAELFEQHTLRWVPPAAGEQMPQGHVPPALLKQWNDIAYERNRFLKAKEPEAAGSKQFENTDVHEPSPDPSSPASGSDSEAESDSPYSWDGSPERDVRPRQQLPADSSPVERHPPKTIIARTDVGNQEPEPPLETEGVNDSGEANEAPTACKPQIVDLEDNAQARQPDSDEESEDSMMDTSVPCPLGVPGSQQTYFVSQSEAEITSSGPSLPGYNQEHVQVVETPAGNAHHLQPRITDKSKTGPAPSEQITTPQDKSSSQSRILNTYASNQTGTQNTQESSNPSQGNEFHGVDIMATQLSNGSWQPQINAASPHPSMAVPNSTSQSDESSKPFSSHNEMLSSIPSGENAENASDIPNSAQGPPVAHAQKSPLKRFASELDVEEPSQSKRYKVTGQARVVNEPTPGVIFCRQNYIGVSSNHSEAQMIYEKFRNDYPLYEGDFMHFTELCFKLRALRAKGDLKRSFLWDDFVIQHLKDYQQHMKQSQSEESKSQEYETYFASNFSKPSFKKRSLTADGIEIAASQHMPTGKADAPASPVTARSQMGTSFTGSLADKFSNLQAHSFGPSTQDLQSDTDDEKVSVAMSSPTPRGRTKWHTPFENPPDRVEEEDIQSSDPGSAEPDQDSEHEAHDAEDAGNPKVVEVERERNTEHDQDVEMADVDTVEMADSAKEMQRRTPVETSKDVEVATETDTIRDAEINSHGRQSKNVEKITEMADAAEEAQVTETAADAEHAEPDIAESRTDVKVAEVAETIEETYVIQETQEFESANESSHEADLMDETHETASIELGDNEPAPTADVSKASEEHELDEVPASDVESEADPEAGRETEQKSEPSHENQAKSINENWFRSLRHIHQRPDGPVWSDDYNTPFKKWARADQNIFRERRRRGGARIPVDENGVIQRFEY